MNTGRRQSRSTSAQRMVAEIQRQQRYWAARMPDADPHDLNLLIWASLRRKYGVPRRWLLRRQPKGGYVC